MSIKNCPLAKNQILAEKHGHDKKNSMEEDGDEWCVNFSIQMLSKSKSDAILCHVMKTQTMIGLS